MYKNLEAELARAKIGKIEIANAINMPYPTFNYKMTNGRFSVEEAFAIHDYLKKKNAPYDMRYLFSSDDEAN